MAKETIRIAARGGGGCVVRRGQTIRVIDVEGQQVADFVCFNLHSPKEKLSTGETVNFNFETGIYLSTGARFYSNLQNAMFEILEDRAKGSHDLLFAPCSPQFYAVLGESPSHPNCRENLAGAVESFGIEYIDVPDPVNLFQYTRPQADGSIEGRPSPTEAGDYIELRALMDCIVAVSACPYLGELRVNGDRCTPIEIQFV